MSEHPFPAPLTTVAPNTPAFLTEPMIVPTGFREYDARWRYPDQINLPGFQALGLGLGTQLRAMGRERIVVGCDYRAYSGAVKQAVSFGLVMAGMAVHDIGVGLSPMVYFAQFALDDPDAAPVAAAMITASHNPNGWTGVKIAADRPLTFGPDEMSELKRLVMSGQGRAAPGGSWHRVEGMAERYLDDLVGETRLSRPLKVVCATGNGAAGLIAPTMLERLGAEVVPLHTGLDYTFPHHNPNPESMEMLHAIRDAVLESGADLGMGFDGDGDRCGVVDNEGHEIFADKVGVMLARSWAAEHAGATIVADVKSTGLFAADPALQAAGMKADYWMTGHSHMKRRVKETGALAGFEKSGHYFLAPPLGRGYDCGMTAAREICLMLDRSGASMADLHRAMPRVWNTPTMSPYCADTEKYEVAARVTAHFEAEAARGGEVAGRRIERVVTVNGARIQLEGGGWGLIRPSSNTPNLVVVCESPNSEDEMRAIFAGLDAHLRSYPEIGAYDQTI